MKRQIAISFVAAVCLAGDIQAQHANRPASKAPSTRSQNPSEPRPGMPAAKATVNPELRPGSAENLERLLKLSPEERSRALSSLPPLRRAQIEKRLNTFQQMSDPVRARALEHLRRMQSLPPDKQAQVRASAQKLAVMEQPRRRQINRQINQLRPLSDAERRAAMDTDEFRSQFTPEEQQMIENICLVTPQTPPR